MSRPGVRAVFDEKARRWRQEFLVGRYSENGERKDLASRWQQYSGAAGSQHMFRATLTEVDNPKRTHTQLAICGGTNGHHLARQLWP